MMIESIYKSSYTFKHIEKTVLKRNNMYPRSLWMSLYCSSDAFITNTDGKSCMETTRSLLLSVPIFSGCLPSGARNSKHPLWMGSTP